MKTSKSKSNGQMVDISNLVRISTFAAMYSKKIKSVSTEGIRFMIRGGKLKATVIDGSTFLDQRQLDLLKT